MTLLEIDALSVAFASSDGLKPAVDGLSLTLAAGETLAVVGESGSGKSVTALSVLGLLAPTARLSGAIRFKGRDLLSCRDRELRTLRGGAIGMVFQEPMSSLNPVLRIGLQIAECFRAHRRCSAAEAEGLALDMLKRVGITAPAQRLREYPHQLSGGMRQRVMIAMALAGRPDLLIADEPTTALDVTVQAQILDLLRQLQREEGAAIMLITHDLGVVAEMAQRVAVMYRGRKVEEASTRALFRAPQHPYTRALLGAVPRLGSSLGATRDRLAEIPVLALQPEEGRGCAFYARCPQAAVLCRDVAPALEPKQPDHLAACHFAPGDPAMAESQSVRSVA